MKKLLSASLTLSVALLAAPLVYAQDQGMQEAAGRQLFLHTLFYK